MAAAGEDKSCVADDYLCVLAGCPIPVTGQTVEAVAIFFLALECFDFYLACPASIGCREKACFQEKAARLGFRRRESSEALIKSGPASGLVTMILFLFR
jgi:hypothetical protein